MDLHEAKRLLLIKINTLDPENASRIMGYFLLQGLSDGDLLRLAFGPDIHLYNVIINAKTQLGLLTNSLSSSSSSSSSAPTSPSPLNPISRPCNGNNPFSQSSPRVAGGGSFADFGTNQNQSPQSTVLSGSLNNGNSNTNSNSSLSPKASPFLSYDNIRSGSALWPPLFSKNGGDSSDSGDNDGDFFDESRIDEYLSFLDDTSSRNEELLELRSQLSGYWGNNGGFYSHRRRFSESDASSSAEDEGLGIGYRPCLYFAKGSCKNGDTCKFVHGCFDGDNAFEVNGVGGGGLFLQRQHEEMLRMKAAQRKLAYTKYMDFLLQQRSDRQRLGTATIMGDKFQKFARYRPERNGLLAMGMAERANPAARQIYLTFPADSTFKDEDVLNYFSTFGPVQDVRIPHQQKRMFGFITFVHPGTVKTILAHGNPHFICDSRVLVKPYKEKGKVANDRTQQHLQQQLLERGNFSTFPSPSGLDPREPYDLHLGTRLQYNNQEMMLRRKLEEQAELQQAIELQGRRLMNLQLPDIRGAYNQCHQRSPSVGNRSNLAAAYTSIFTAPGKKFQEEINLPWSQKNNTANGKVGGFISETCDVDECHEGNMELTLPDSLFSSPSNSSGNDQPAFSDLTEIKDTTELSFASSSEDESSIALTSAGNGP